MVIVNLMCPLAPTSPGGCGLSRRTPPLCQAGGGARQQGFLAEEEERRVGRCERRPAMGDVVSGLATMKRCCRFERPAFLSNPQSWLLARPFVGRLECWVERRSIQGAFIWRSLASLRFCQLDCVRSRLLHVT
jgi:hypothetical protein